ncbi:Hpr(Ser) kinase/phosphatase [Novosphingobium kunmingense]|uniref:Hpr(Ser) kinase/phosphatase n=1 Tax=Novosphingobium kunmingense TaxID=1211806 RepID=A0A2N0I1H2_9SPHN|nr:HPr kinase/phosphatase C-terminal domain-containing protein [Novosphingobium kunmingense]PKB25001.1 Hpr(Ser) kinase/phosphatase [Novosphingobium kunmingense]
MSLLLNVSAVSCAGRGVLIEGAAGSGKSSLTLALIDRGAMLIGDDGLRIESRGNRLIASPPPKASGLIEVRNVGLLPFPTVDAVPLCLVLTLDPAAPRFVDAAEILEVEGQTLPLIRLWPDSPQIALRAEAALRQWGLPAC